MMSPTGAQDRVGPTGKSKNCNCWAQFEEMGTSPTANLCHGGRCDNEYYDPCESKYECRLATIREKHEENKRRLPILNPAHPSSSVIAQTGNVPQRPYSTPYQYQSQPQQKAYPYGAPTTAPARSYNQQYQQCQPVMPPSEYPWAMQTPYAAPAPIAAEGCSTPTFLPEEGEGMMTRLGKNVAQGMFGAAGWHVFSYMRNVDLFRRRR